MEFKSILAFFPSLGRFSLRGRPRFRSACDVLLTAGDPPKYATHSFSGPGSNSCVSHLSFRPKPLSDCVRKHRLLASESVACFFTLCPQILLRFPPFSVSIGPKPSHFCSRIRRPISSESVRIASESVAICSESLIQLPPNSSAVCLRICQDCLRIHRPTSLRNTFPVRFRFRHGF